MLSITVDGEQVVLQTTTMTAFDVMSAFEKDAPPQFIRFVFAENRHGTIFFQAACEGMLPVPSVYRFALYVEGESPLDEGSKKGTNEEGKDFKIWVTKADVNGDEVVWYRIDTRRISTGMEVAVHRRFRDFHFLHSQLLNHFKGTHLAKSMPQPPAKGIKWLQDHLDPDFVEERRQALESYMKKLLLFPRVGQIQDMHDFLGLMGGRLRETSLMFGIGPLGLKMMRKGTGVSRCGVVQFNTVSNGEGQQVMGPAEASGLVCIGDSVTKVQGDDVTQHEYDEIIQMIRTANRPLLLHFTGYPVVFQDAHSEGETKN